MDDSRIARRIERWQPIGKRSRDKQKPRWKDVAIEKVNHEEQNDETSKRWR